MRLLLLPLCLALLTTTPREEEVAYGLEEGDELVRTFVARASYESDDVLVEVDGEEQDLSEVELPTLTIESLETVVVRDVIAEADEGRPLDFRRTFEELTQEATFTTSLGDEEAEQESEESSDLVDVTVRFVWDDDDEAYWAEWDDPDEALDDDLLEWLTPDLDLAGLLPEDPVEEGDSWEVDGSPYLTLMWPGGLVGWYDTENEDGPDPFGAEQNREIVENLDGEGTVTFLEVRDEDGVRVAVLGVEIDIDTDAESEVEDGPTITIDMDRTIEGEVLWDLEHGHLLSAELTADSSWSRTVSREIESPTGDVHEVDETQYFEGEVRYEADVERE